MDNLLLMGTLALTVVGFTWFPFSRKKKRHSLYQSAIHLLLEGRKEEALEKLKKTVTQDSDNIPAYIQLGAIYRDIGFPVRAAKIHRQLLVRSNLDEDERISILRHLVLDYKASNALDLAVETAERLTQRDKKDVENKKLLLSLYEQKGDWDKAFFYRQGINKWMKQGDQSILALYKVMSGIHQVEEGAEREGRIRFREAIKLDKACVPAYLNWGDSYRREGRTEDALKTWKDLTNRNPNWAHLAFDRLKDALYELGRYSEMEQIYQQVIQKKPKTADASIQFIEFLRKQGRLDQALDFCEQVIEQYPDSVACKIMLVQVLRKKGNVKEALDLAEKILSKEFKQSDLYNCSNCGYETSDPSWHCPNCHQWDTFLRN